MKRNCYLDLRLHSSSSHRSMNGTLNIHNKLHNGRHIFFDMAEFQARVIIWSASREMEESSGLQSRALLMYVSQGLSMKKSLHNFLQKRKKRSQSHSSNTVAHNVKN